jgi:hypothetical protein
VPSILSLNEKSQETKKRLFSEERKRRTLGKIKRYQDIRKHRETEK